MDWKIIDVEVIKLPLNSITVAQESRNTFDLIAKIIPELCKLISAKSGGSSA